jgi:hypothetical protein
MGILSAGMGEEEIFISDELGKRVWGMYTYLMNFASTDQSGHFIFFPSFDGGAIP